MVKDADALIDERACLWEIHRVRFSVMDGKDKTVEIERKFLVKEGWRPPGEGVRMRQGYVPTSNRSAVRVRIAGDRAWLTLKTPRVHISRREFEYEIPVDDAADMLELLCAKQVSKTRTRVDHAGHVWEVDVFEGDNEGLVIAEIELGSEEESFELPDWVGEDVSHDLRYANSALSERPYKTFGLDG